MESKKTVMILAGLAVITLGVGNMGWVSSMPRSAQTPDNQKTPRSVQKSTSEQYAKLTGEAYDRAYLSNMIVHHESAMNMAELALSKSQRQEIRDLATSIAITQGKEVATMLNLQTKFGFPNTAGHNMQDMTASDSMEGMSSMNGQLTNLSGDAFDKKFIELMIEHHQQAIDMAQPAENNALNQEVKELARGVITEQTREIAQLKQWQKDWGF